MPELTHNRKGVLHVRTARKLQLYRSCYERSALQGMAG